MKKLTSIGFAVLLSSVYLIAHADPAMTAGNNPQGSAMTAGSRPQGSAMMSGSNPQAHGMRGEEHGPCHKLMSACEAAGYVKGGYKTGKGLFKDCIKPLISGQSVAGVTIAQDDIAACQAHREKHQAEKANK